MKIAIVAGGTGGHIYPAISLAEELRNRGHEIVFIGSNDRMEKDVIPDSGFDYIGLDVYTTRGSIFQKLKSLLSIGRAYFKCKKILEDYDMAIGFGNYISIPVMEAAINLKKKTVIHEQNSFVGKANRLLDDKVDLIIGSYKENLDQFKNKNTLILGNPQSSKAYDIKKDPSLLTDIGLDPNKKTVLIFMGSLGSSTVNEKLIEYFNNCDDSYQIVYATGKSHYQNAINNIKEKDNIKVFERVDGAKMMKNCDLLICRAGATTIAEICALGVASILVPSPFVPNNHQYYNGKALVDEDAAIMIEEKDLTADKLNDIVNKLISDDSRLETLRNNAKKLSNPNVMNDIIEAIENI